MLLLLLELLLARMNRDPACTTQLQRQHAAKPPRMNLRSMSPPFYKAPKKARTFVAEGPRPGGSQVHRSAAHGGSFARRECLRTVG